MGIKSFNQAAPRYFPNVFGPNSSNSDSKTSQFTGAERLKDTNVFLGPSASRDDTITQLRHYENCLGTLSRGLIPQRKFCICSCILPLCERKSEDCRVQTIVMTKQRLPTINMSDKKL